MPGLCLCCTCSVLVLVVAGGLPGYIPAFHTGGMEMRWCCVYAVSHICVCAVYVLCPSCDCANIVLLCILFVCWCIRAASVVCSWCFGASCIQVEPRQAPCLGATRAGALGAQPGLGHPTPPGTLLFYAACIIKAMSGMLV